MCVYNNTWISLEESIRSNEYSIDFPFVNLYFFETYRQNAPFGSHCEICAVLTIFARNEKSLLVFQLLTSHHLLFFGIDPWEFGNTMFSKNVNNRRIAGRSGRVDSVSTYYVGGLPIESRQPTSVTNVACREYDRLPCRIHAYTVYTPIGGKGRCHTRCDLQDHSTQARKSAGEISTLDLKPMRKDTQSPKQEQSVAPQIKILKKKNKRITFTIVNSFF